MTRVAPGSRPGARSRCGAAAATSGELPEFLGFQTMGEGRRAPAPRMVVALTFGNEHGSWLVTAFREKESPPSF